MDIAKFGGSDADLRFWWPRLLDYFGLFGASDSRVDFWLSAKKTQGKKTQNSKKKLKTQGKNSIFRHFLKHF